MKLELDPADLAPVIAETVRQTLAELQADGAQLSEHRLGFTEPQAAASLGIPQHSLRDARLRGELSAVKLGKRYVYSRTELLRFLAGKRVEER